MNIEETYHYLEVPILLKTRFGILKSPLSIYAGPSVAKLLTANNKTRAFNQTISGDISEVMKPWDISFIFGADFNISSAILIECRYNMSVTKVYDIDTDCKNRALSVNIGYRLK